MAGVECSLSEFTDHLFRYGFKAEQVGQRWQLALPGKFVSIGSGKTKKLMDVGN